MIMLMLDDLSTIFYNIVYMIYICGVGQLTVLARVDGENVGLLLQNWGFRTVPGVPKHSQELPGPPGSPQKPPGASESPPDAP